MRGLWQEKSPREVGGEGWRRVTPAPLFFSLHSACACSRTPSTGSTATATSALAPVRARYCCCPGLCLAGGGWEGRIAGGELSGQGTDGHHGTSDPCSEVHAPSVLVFLELVAPGLCWEKTPPVGSLASPCMSRHLVLCLCLGLGRNLSLHFHSSTAVRNVRDPDERPFHASSWGHNSHSLLNLPVTCGRALQCYGGQVRRWLGGLGDAPASFEQGSCRIQSRSMGVPRLSLLLCTGFFPSQTTPGLLQHGEP